MRAHPLTPKHEQEPTIFCAIVYDLLHLNVIYIYISKFIDVLKNLSDIHMSIAGRC